MGSPEGREGVIRWLVAVVGWGCGARLATRNTSRVEEEERKAGSNKTRGVETVGPGRALEGMGTLGKRKGKSGTIQAAAAELRLAGLGLHKQGWEARWVACCTPTWSAVINKR